MSTPHNGANKGDIAKLVLLPGDPLRAKFVAETYFENPVLFNDVRGMLGYTGIYKGHRISVMGSGMGMASLGIYSHELYNFYDVEAIIRIGSCGAFVPELHAYDVILVDKAYSESSYALNKSGCTDHIMYPSKELFDQLEESAKSLGYPVIVNGTLSSDNFYYDEAVASARIAAAVEAGTVCAEMESFALFHNANVAGKKAATVLTVSDSMITHEDTTPEERQNSFTKMMEIALGVAGYYD